MAVPFSNTKLRVPKGFQNILEGLAREILRSQPDNPFEFGAKYFDQLLKVREETGHDPAVHGARLEDRFYNNDSFKSPSVDPGSPQQQDAALTIQTNYRKHDAEQKVAAIKQEAAAETIQAGVRGHEEREKVKDMKDNKQAEEEEVDIDLNDPEVEAAAMKIQAGFKGFKARQEIKDKKDQSQTVPAPQQKEEDKKKEEEEEEIDIDLNDPEVSNAALKIQAGFRGHQSRKQMKAEQDTGKQDDTIDEGNTGVIPDDPELADAALKIQTSFRAHAARQEVEAMKEENKVETETKPTDDNEPIDIDLNDPEVGQAALKIQAGFRGHQTRKQMKESKDTQGGEETSNTAPDTGNSKDEEVDIDLTDPEVGEAALKIQAGFRGHKARKEIAEKKDTKQTDPEKSDPQKEEVDIDLKDPEVEDAALKIQAGFKGMKARQEIKAMKDEKDQPKTEEPAKEEKPAEEAVDIDLNDPETEKAALKIQAGFKGYQTRKEIQSKKEAQKPKEDEPKTEATEEKKEETKAEATEEKKEETKTEATEEKKVEEEAVDIDLNDPDVEKAATKIQAGFKGYKTRKDLKDKTDSGEGTTEAQGESKKEGEEEAVDIDLNDPEVAKAATKIQAGFKGYKTRQEISKTKSENVEGTEGETKTEGDIKVEKTEGTEDKTEGEGQKSETNDN